VIPATAVVLTRDEAPNIGACLAPVVGRFRRVVVVDSHSRDGTAEIAAAAGADVVPFSWDGGYPKKKQRALDGLGPDERWAFLLDADERATPELLDEMEALFRAGPRRAAYWVEARPVFLGRALRFGRRHRKISLLDRTRARFPVVDDLDVPEMWEVEGHYQPVVDGGVGRLRSAMLHADAKPLDAWFDRHERYAAWEAALARDGRRDRLGAWEGPARRLALAASRRVPARPLAAFADSYLLRLGFLDGSAGLHWALARAFHCWRVEVRRRALDLDAAGALRPRPDAPRPAP
jgi:glycosyltransferase involved in cell wall biosynthesis